MIAVMPVFCLSMHASYLCRHSGACCTAGWDIPAEPHVIKAAQNVHLDEPAPLFMRLAGEQATVAKRADGSCVFFGLERGREEGGVGGGLCAIHRQAGSNALPSACRHFPRVVLSDARGTFVTLSHSCPTAAAMLLDAGPLRIVEALGAIALGGALEGLDATAVLPPLLRPGVLMDYEGVEAWERAGIAVLDRDDVDVDGALDIIAAATAALTRWSPCFESAQENAKVVGRRGGESLASAVEREFALAIDGCRVRDASGDRPLRAFLAAHLFANWALYQDGGPRGVIDDLRAALGTLRREMHSHDSFVEAVRAADLYLRHATERGIQYQPLRR